MKRTVRKILDRTIRAIPIITLSLTFPFKIDTEIIKRAHQDIKVPNPVIRREETHIYRSLVVEEFFKQRELEDLLRHDIMLQTNPRHTLENLNYFDKLLDYCREYKLDPLLMKLVIDQESGWNPNAKSHKGAYGYTQIMPITAKTLGYKPRDVKDPFKNIEMGVRYMKRLVDRYGNTELALAAYNAGPKNVDKYNGIPEFRETRKYVASIMKKYREYIERLKISVNSRRNYN